MSPYSFTNPKDLISPLTKECGLDLSRDLSQDYIDLQFVHWLGRSARRSSHQDALNIIAEHTTNEPNKLTKLHGS